MSDYPTYRIYLGEHVGNVSLWKRVDDTTEKPIMANTRGLNTWFSYNFDEYANTEPLEPSDAFVAWLDEYYRRIFGAGEMRQNRELGEPEWYENSILNSIADPKLTQEQEELLQWAHEHSGREP